MSGMFLECRELRDIGTDPAAFGKGDTTDMFRNTPLEKQPESP